MVAVKPGLCYIFERYVGGTTTVISKDDYFMQSKEGDLYAEGKTIVEVQNQHSSRVKLDKETILATEKDGNCLEINPETLQSKAGTAALILKKDESATLKLSKDGFEADARHVMLNSEKVVLDLCKSGEIYLIADNVNVDGKNVTIKGESEVSINSSAKVFVEGGGGTVDVSGGMVKLNS